MTPESRPFWFTWDGDRDCLGNPGRMIGCRCINHRPDLYNSTMTITGATLCTGTPPPSVNAANIMPITTSGTIIVTFGAR